MKDSGKIRCYAYLNHPYEQVRDALNLDPGAVCGQATRAAESRAQTVAALSVNLGGIEIGTDITVTVDRVEETPGKATTPATTRLYLQWEAAHSPRLFPLMQAELAVYPLTGRETQLDFGGRYQPPLGALGRIIDAVLAHRLAEAAVHRFLGEVSGHLSNALETKTR
jgi:hypothetical protein